MSEKQKESKPLSKRLVEGAVFGGAAATTVLGISGCAPGEAEATMSALSDTQISEEVAEGIVEGRYPEDCVIGNIKITQSDLGRVHSRAEEIVRDYLGDEDFNQHDAEINNVLYPTSMQHSLVHDGDILAVVGYDLDPEANNGKEYFVVSSKNILITLEEGEQIPSPNVPNQNQGNPSTYGPPPPA